MYFFVLLAHPKPTHAEYGQVDGAYVACWVDEPTEALAEHVARQVIDGVGWDVEERDEAYRVQREDYEPGSESLERFDQALVDGCVLTFHRWDVGAPDEC